MLDATDPATLDAWIDLGRDGETIEEFAARTAALPAGSVVRTRHELRAADYIAEHGALLDELVNAQPGQPIRVRGDMHVRVLWQYPL